VSTTCHGSSQLSVSHLAVNPFTARDGARYWLRIAYTHLHSTPHWGSQSEYGHDVWYGKLNWFSQPKVKKKWRYVYVFWQNSRMWQIDGRTDRHCMTFIASRGENQTQTLSNWRPFFARTDLLFLRKCDSSCNTHYCQHLVIQVHHSSHRQCNINNVTITHEWISSTQCKIYFN